MASAGFLLLTLAVLNSAGSSQGYGFVKIHCKTQNIGQYEQESRLDCVIHYSGEVKDPEILVVIWSREGFEEPILKYENGKLTSLPGYSFAEPSWNNKNVNVSLLIHKTAVKDEGDYTCYVCTDGGFNTNQTRLNVTGLGQDTKDSNMILATMIVASVLVVGSLIVGSLVLLLYKRRSWRWMFKKV
nr:uncharacterized protein LOC109975834 isoform X2 [Labrus bergylta]